MSSRRMNRIRALRDIQNILASTSGHWQDSDHKQTLKMGPQTNNKENIQPPNKDGRSRNQSRHHGLAASDVTSDATNCKNATNKKISKFVVYDDFSEDATQVMGTTSKKSVVYDENSAVVRHNNEKTKITNGFSVYDESCESTTKTIDTNQTKSVARTPLMDISLPITNSYGPSRTPVSRDSVSPHATNRRAKQHPTPRYARSVHFADEELIASQSDAISKVQRRISQSNQRLVETKQYNGDRRSTLFFSQRASAKPLDRPTTQLHSNERRPASASTPMKKSSASISISTYTEEYPELPDVSPSYARHVRAIDLSHTVSTVSPQHLPSRTPKSPYYERKEQSSGYSHANEVSDRIELSREHKSFQMNQSQGLDMADTQDDSLQSLESILTQASENENDLIGSIRSCVHETIQTEASMFQEPTERQHPFWGSPIPMEQTFSMIETEGPTHDSREIEFDDTSSKEVLDTSEEDILSTTTVIENSYYYVDHRYVDPKQASIHYVTEKVSENNYHYDDPKQASNHHVIEKIPPTPSIRRKLHQASQQNIIVVDEGTKMLSPRTPFYNKRDQVDQEEIIGIDEREIIRISTPMYNQYHQVSPKNVIVIDETETMPPRTPIQNEYHGAQLKNASDSRVIELLSPKTPLQEQQMARSFHRQDFESLKFEYSQSIRNLIEKNDAPTDLSAPKNGPIFVVRTRPLLPAEAERGNFAIVDIPPESSRTMALYETNALLDQSVLDLKAHVFQFDAVFSERTSFDEFYSGTVQWNVKDAMNGGLGAILLFGSDNFERSHTLSNIERKVAADLFSESSMSTNSISVKYLGLGTCSDFCMDLLSPVNHYVEIIEANGEYHAEGAIEIDISSARNFLDTMCRVRRRLASEASSYSLCQISIRNERNESGTLYLVVCPPGDEVLHPQGVETNHRYTNPLANLMDLMRSKIPVENSTTHERVLPCQLTRLLGQPILARKHSRVCLVAAISPASDDTNATLSTLLSSREYMDQNVHVLSKSDPIGSSGKYAHKEESLVLPRQWSKDRLLRWLKTKHYVHAAFEGDITGKMIMTMTKAQLKEYFFWFDKNGIHGASKLFHALRGESDRIARLRVKRKFALEKAKVIL